MFKVNNKDVNSVFIFNFIVNVTYSGFFIVNFEHFSHDVKNAEMRALYWKKERKVRLTVCQLKCFSSRI